MPAPTGRGISHEVDGQAARAVPGGRVPHSPVAVLARRGRGAEGGVAAPVRRAPAGELPGEAERRRAHGHGPALAQRRLCPPRPPSAARGARPADPGRRPLHPAGQGECQGGVLGRRLAMALRFRHPSRRGRRAGAARAQPSCAARRGDGVQRADRLHPRLAQARGRAGDPGYRDDELSALGGRQRDRGQAGGRRRSGRRQGAARHGADLRRCAGARLIHQHVALAAHDLLADPEPGLQRADPPQTAGAPASPRPDPGRAARRQLPARRTRPGRKARLLSGRRGRRRRERRRPCRFRAVRRALVPPCPPPARPSCPPTAT